MGQGMTSWLFVWSVRIEVYILWLRSRCTLWRVELKNYAFKLCKYIRLSSGVLFIHSFIHSCNSFHHHQSPKCKLISGRKVFGHYITSVYYHQLSCLPLLFCVGYGKVFLVRKIVGEKKGSLFAMKVLKKATVVRKRKVMEHTMTERNVLEAIRDFPFLATLHYAFQTDAKLHLIMGGWNLCVCVCVCVCVFYTVWDMGFG